MPEVVSVVHNPQHTELFRRIGVGTTENPQWLVAEYLYRALERPNIVDYVRIDDRAEVFETGGGEDAPVAGRTLQQAAAEGLLPGDAARAVRVDERLDRVGADDGRPRAVAPAGDPVVALADPVGRRRRRDRLRPSRFSPVRAAGTTRCTAARPARRRSTPASSRRSGRSGRSSWGTRSCRSSRCSSPSRCPAASTASRCRPSSGSGRR